MSAPSGRLTPQEIRELIGDPVDRDGPADFGMGLEAQLLRDYGHPDELLELADRLDALPSDPGFSEVVASLRDWAEIVRDALDRVEAAGLTFDPEGRRLRIPTGARGRPPEVVPRMIGAAWEELGGEKLSDWYGSDTLQAVRDRLFHLLPHEELTDTRLKSRIQEYLRR